MSTLNRPITKQPLKLIEVPLNKFKEEAIPHHQNVYEQHRLLVLKLIAQGNVPLVRQEVKNKKRIIKQLKDLMYELDTLRAQVEDSDLDKFDTKTLSLRKIIINLISGYQGIEKRSLCLENELNEQNEKSLKASCPFEGASKIQVLENIDEVKLRQQKEILNDVENVQRDTEDLNEMFTQLNEMVNEQKEYVDQVEENVEETQENVQSGLKQIIKAHKLKSAAYPVTGAFLGSIIGGPIGLVAGLKIGGITALGCAIAGYTGGKFFKKNCDEKEERIDEEENDSNAKKDI